jgi:diguanylate cyclase (GGDEF)-like protein
MMELKTYLTILLRKWWIVLPAFLVTLTAGIVFTYLQTPIYSATTTYLVVPGAAFGSGENYAGGLDLLSRRAQIAMTFTEIASSRKVKGQAAEAIGTDSLGGYSVSSKLLADTNIIEFTVDGPNPTTVRDLANALGAATDNYVRGLYEVFNLRLLDEATVPGNPVSPNKSLNITLAAIFGLILGGGLAFMSEYLGTPLTSAISMNIIDEKTGVYNRQFFLRRLGEEMVRAKRNRYPLSLALMRIDDLGLLKGINAGKVRTEMLRQVAMLTNEYLREEDLVAHFDGDIFAILLPDTTGENAKAIMEYLQTRVAWTPFESATGDSKFNLKSIVGIVNYGNNGTSRDELVTKASRALELAEVEHNGKAYLISDYVLYENNDHVKDNSHG